MTPQAKDWDKKYGNSVEHNEVRDGRFIPKNRPCDWCGQTVDSGYIHERCAVKEARFILDLVGKYTMPRW